MFVQSAMMLGLPALFAGIFLAASYKILIFAELLMPLQLSVMALVILVIYAAGFFEVTFQLRFYQTLVFFASYTILILFSTATWHPAITLFRALLVNSVLFAIITHMSRLGDPIVPEESFALSIIITITMEIANHSNVKAQAHLFMQVKAMQKQQNQLEGLLNLVPDSVFICTKRKDEKEPKGIFANFKMNKFFGCNVLARSLQPKQPRSFEDNIRKRPKRQNSLQRRLFQKVDKLNALGSLEQANPERN